MLILRMTSVDWRWVITHKVNSYHVFSPGAYRYTYAGTPSIYLIIITGGPYRWRAIYKWQEYLYAPGLALEALFYIQSNQKEKTWELPDLLLFTSYTREFKGAGEWDQFDAENWGPRSIGSAMRTNTDRHTSGQDLKYHH